MRISSTQIVRCGKCDEEEYLFELVSRGGGHAGMSCKKCGAIEYEGRVCSTPFTLIRRPEPARPQPRWVAIDHRRKEGIMAGVGKQTVQSVREYVTAHPGSRTDAVMWALDMSQATASAALKELVEEGHLRYRMNEETGKRCFPLQFEASDGEAQEVTRTVPVPKERPRLRAEKQGTGHVLVPKGKGSTAGPYIVWLHTRDGYVPYSYDSTDQINEDVQNGTLFGQYIPTRILAIKTVVLVSDKD